METQNWLVTDEADYHAFGTPEIPACDGPEGARIYRLYRFLSDLDDILETYSDDISRLKAITPLVRRLLISSYWLQLEYKEPSPETGWAVNFLYREYQYPLTVQMVTWSPGSHSTIHNHGTWGLVALIGGQEKNRLWRRVPDLDHPHRIEPATELILNPGDIITFTPDAIHSVEPLGDTPTVSFNLYGVTDRSQRYQFDPERQDAKLF